MKAFRLGDNARGTSQVVVEMLFRSSDDQETYATNKGGEGPLSAPPCHGAAPSASLKPLLPAKAK